MTPSEKVTAVLKRTLSQLHALEEGVELAGALHPSDSRLKDTEIALHRCIGEIERVSKHPGANEKWNCSKHGHVDNGGMFLGACKHCGEITDPL